LQFSDWDIKEIGGFAICGLIIKNWQICGLASPQKFSICGLTIKNLQAIYGLRFSQDKLHFLNIGQ
jgi:hypothetical protein